METEGHFVLNGVTNVLDGSLILFLMLILKIGNVSDKYSQIGDSVLQNQSAEGVLRCYHEWKTSNKGQYCLYLLILSNVHVYINYYGTYVTSQHLIASR